METRHSPKTLTTKRRVKYRNSSWSVHEFEVWSGELVCRVAVLRTAGALLVWAGGREARLSELALALPEGGRGALSTALLGDAGGPGGAVGLARRLAAALQRPAHVCTGLAFDRFTAPLVERGIAAEIKAHPEHFGLSQQYTGTL